MDTKPSDRYNLKPDKFITATLQMTEEYCVYKHPLHTKLFQGLHIHVNVGVAGGGGRDRESRWQHSTWSTGG